MIGSGIEDPPVERLGLGELFALLEQDGDRDRFVERQIAALRVGLDRQLVANATYSGVHAAFLGRAPSMRRRRQPGNAKRPAATDASTSSISTLEVIV
jgi:hypothetical protein